jgi:hydroxyacylglutathione hydrolase
MEITPIRALRDNYIWVLHHHRHAVVVDPGEARPVLAWLAQAGIDLLAILCTHHHGDHVDGNAELVAHHPSVSVYGPACERIPMLTKGLVDNDVVALPELDLNLRVLAVPGHTAGHLAYYGSGLLFCGDTLFACGCGRIFEGSAEQMYASLLRLAALPSDTRVYCAHEYTLANIRFAKEVEPGNDLLNAWEVEARAQVAQGLPTIPTSLGREKAANPFLRCHEPGVMRSAQRHAGLDALNAVQAFALIRQWKNNF